jgi:hypothetical protein
MIGSEFGHCAGWSGEKVISQLEGENTRDRGIYLLLQQSARPDLGLQRRDDGTLVPKTPLRWLAVRPVARGVIGSPSCKPAASGCGQALVGVASTAVAACCSLTQVLLSSQPVSTEYEKGGCLVRVWAPRGCVKAIIAVPIDSQAGISHHETELPRTLKSSTFV